MKTPFRDVMIRDSSFIKNYLGSLLVKNQVKTERH